MGSAPLTSYSDDPKVDALVNEIIGRVADKWTLLVLQALEEKGPKRFSVLARGVQGSAKRC